MQRKVLTRIVDERQLNWQARWQRLASSKTKWRENKMEKRTCKCPLDLSVLTPTRASQAWFYLHYPLFTRFHWPCSRKLAANPQVAAGVRESERDLNESIRLCPISRALNLRAHSGCLANRRRFTHTHTQAGPCWLILRYFAWLRRLDSHELDSGIALGWPKGRRYVQVQLVGYTRKSSASLWLPVGSRANEWMWSNFHCYFNL